MSECGGGDQTASSATLSALPASVSASAPASSSPKSRVKFMCSYGGKILPRPADGHLKYVGGETRVVAVSRDISFAELMQKLSNFYEGDFVLKYQISSEDLDALISVRSDEDLRHMWDEYNRQEAGGTPKLRAFLFQSKPLIVDNQTMEPHALEQRYVDAINGIVRRNNLPRRMSINTSRPTFTISSACSSPKPLSPNSPTPIPMGYEAVPASNLQTSRPLPMHRVQSSPTLCSFRTLRTPKSISTTTATRISSSTLTTTTMACHILERQSLAGVAGKRRSPHYQWDGMTLGGAKWGGAGTSTIYQQGIIKVEAASTAATLDAVVMDAEDLKGQTAYLIWE